MRKKKSTEQFIEELKLKRPDITVLGEYVKSKIKVKVKHSCGYQWEITPNNLFQGKSCPECYKIEASKKYTKTTQQFIEELKLKRPDITVLGEYVKSNIKVEVKHTCGYQWEAIPGNLLQGTSCTKCSRIKSGKKQKKPMKQFIEELKIVNPEITVIGKYVANNKKIEVKHTCGYQWEAITGNLLQGTSCPKCFGTFKKTTEQFIKELKIVKPEITVIGEYVNNKTKIEVKHTCGYKWEATPNNLLQGTSCPRCNESKGEKFLSKVLKSNNIPFTSQFNLVKNTKTNYWLKSDFAILNKDGEPILILEYDGEQHFKSVDYFGGKEALRDTQYRDSLKDKYCKENNIPFIRFNYKQSETDITYLLLKQLKKLKLI